MGTLTVFAAERADLERFLDASGVSLEAFRIAAADGSLQRGLLQYLAGDEALLIKVAARMNVGPESLAESIERHLQL